MGARRIRGAGLRMAGVCAGIVLKPRRKDPRMRAHPNWKVAEHSKFCIPLQLHSDGADMTVTILL
eukprot:4106227-Pyramimonas_sp.AAC.1